PDSSFRSAWSSGVSSVIPGAAVSGLQPMRQGTGAGFFTFFFFFCEDCPSASGIPPAISESTSTTAQTLRAAAAGEHAAAAVLTAVLAMPRGRGVRVVAESVRIALREDFHHPAIKVIHRVVHDGFKTPVVFSMSFFNVVFQSNA